MPTNERSQRPHFVWNEAPDVREFRSPSSGGRSPQQQPRDSATHGASLGGQLRAVAQQGEAVIQAQADAGDDADGFGLLLEFESFPDLALVFKSLSREAQGIALRSVQHEGGITRASVWVPREKLSHFEKLITTYMQTGRGRPLVDSIRAIRHATLRDLWTDDLGLFPQDAQQSISWEVWLPTWEHPEVETRFRAHAAAVGLVVERAALHFAERTVVWLRGSVAQWQQSLPLLLCVAEPRKAKETADFFDSLPPIEQREWVDELLARSTIPPEGADVPHVCVLDTGLTRGHPLIAPAAASADLHTVMDVQTDVADDANHGTPMSGLALWGDLKKALESRAPIQLSHRLESVKLIADTGANAGTPQQHGYWTQQAVSLPEIAAARRHRVFCLAISSEDGRDQGRPSSWSAAVDALAYGDGEAPRLICVAAGNVRDNAALAAYPTAQHAALACDPAQAWNALTVGAYTEKLRITERDARDLRAVAPSGGLSPFSTTTMQWDDQWPFKPDIVMEGGNAGSDGHNAFAVTSLGLLSAHHNPQERSFTGINATSAATALAAGMAAQLQADYPAFWPETIRALMAHSASWTPAMEQAAGQGAPTVKNRKLLRQFGHGVPNLQLARYSAEDSLTLIVQGELQPFFRDEDGDYKTFQMHIHELPWPIDELAALEETRVQMRVTLSTFIEPNPSERGYNGRYRYAGHGLRFRLRDASETADAFAARVNRLDREAEEGPPPGGRAHETGWTLGPDFIRRGSLLCDTWTGTARDLASRYLIAVHPSIGWWRERPKLQRHYRSVRYALLVSIRAPGVETDLYTAVETAIAARVQTRTQVAIETP